MKKIKTLALMILVFFISINSVSAACTAEENVNLTKEAYNIKVSYEPKTEAYLDVDPPDGDPEDFTPVISVFHEIYITNVTENLYVKVTDSIKRETKTYTYKDAKDGVITFRWDNLWEVTNFTIEVYSSDKTNCPNTKLFTTYLTTPLYNDYSNYEICSGIEEFYLCYEYLSIPQVDFYTFESLASKYREGLIDKNGNAKKEEEKGFIAFVKKHKAMIGVTSIVVIVAGGIVTVIIVRKQRRVI